MAPARNEKGLHIGVQNLRRFPNAPALISTRFGLRIVRSHAGLMSYRCPGVTSLRAAVSGGADA